VPYLYEREETNCENLPETHAYLKRLRQFVDQNYPGRILLCEANQWPEDVRPYFGEGDEFQMGFHFPLMPRVFMALRQENVAPLVWILDRTPPIPSTCQWCTFLRNHDELTLEMVTEEERHWMWQEYAPDPRMRLNLGIRRRLAPLLDNNRQKIELANSLLFSIIGSPILYYGDEIGMGDDIWMADRNGVRTPMQWEPGPGAGFSKADPARFYAPLIGSAGYHPNVVNVASQRADPTSMWHSIRRMIAVRKSNPAFGRGDFAWAELVDRDLADPQSLTADAGAIAEGRTQAQPVAAYWRRYETERLLIVNNLSSRPQKVSIAVPESAKSPIDMLRGEQISGRDGKRLDLRLEPYQYWWLRL
jgi:maltose alpha-D-glucosyltransferase/alpha-amylase